MLDNGADVQDAGLCPSAKAAGPRRNKDDTVCFLVWHFYELTST